MLKFILLETKKHRLITMVKGIATANLCIMVLIAIISYVDGANGHVAFESFSFAFSAIHSFVKPTMIMFSVVLLVKLIVEECRSKTISLMFLYPLTRQRILWYKVIMVVGFAILTIFMSNMLIGVILVIVNPIIGIVPEAFKLTDAVAFAWDVLKDAWIAGGLVLFPLFVGLRKYSVAATLVTATVMVILLLTQLGAIPWLPPALGAIGLLGAYFGIKRMQHVDL